MKKGWKILGGFTVGVVAVAAAPFTGGGSLLAGAAALGLGTSVAIGSAVAAGTAGGLLANFITKDNLKIRKGLVILGMSGAGKTTIYDFLQGKKNAGNQTAIADYKEFKYYFDSENSVNIREGIDIGGGEEFIRTYYGKMLNNDETDFCFFVFNCYEYLNNKDYMRKVNARLEYIQRLKISNKKLVVIGSFPDNFKKEERAHLYKKINELVQNKTYSELLNRSHLQLIDLTNESEIRKLIKSTLTK